MKLHIRLMFLLFMLCALFVSTRAACKENAPDFHNGVDLTAKEGTDVPTVADGRVVEVEYEPHEFGYYIVIEHFDKEGKSLGYSLYAHLDEKIKVKAGDIVNRGQTIGTVGDGNINCGFSSGPHLHAEIRVHGIGKIKYGRWQDAMTVDPVVFTGFSTAVNPQHGELEDEDNFQRHNAFGDGAKEVKAVQASDVWEKVYEYDGPVDREPPTWCGKDALAIRAHDWAKEVGGYVYVNLVTKEQFWITKDLYVLFNGCSYDGSTAFLIERKYPNGDEGELTEGGESAEGREPATITEWVYDIKTRKAAFKYDESNLGDRNTYGWPASPVDKRYFVVTDGGDYKDKKNACKIKLPGWKILCITPYETEIPMLSHWSNDGSYIILFKGGGDYRLIVHSNTGKKIGLFEMGSGNGKSENNEKQEWLIADPIAMSDGVYYFKEDGILRRVNIPSGTTDVLPVKVVRNKGRLFAFDVSVTNKEVAYTNAGRNELADAYVAMFGGKTADYDLSETVTLSEKHELGGLYIATFDGKTSYQLSETGALAGYSPTGEYLAFQEHWSGRENIFVVYKRKNNVSQ